MNGAEVGATAAYYFANNYTFATMFRTRLAFAAIDHMLGLEFTSFALEISIIGSGVSAKIKAFFEHCLN
jgi:hypothetical protein